MPYKCEKIPIMMSLSSKIGIFSLFMIIEL